MGIPWQVCLGSCGPNTLFPSAPLGQQLGRLPLPSRSHSPRPVQSPPRVSVVGRCGYFWGCHGISLSWEG